MRIVIAVPTIELRRQRRPMIQQLWTERTPDVELEIVFSEAGQSWGDGLNDVYQQTRADPPAVFVCASDDMVPGDERWLPTLLPWLEQNLYPAPKVEDPRFTNYGGHTHPVPDGTPGDMSTFPILRGDWLDQVFPLPAELHYFADSLLSTRLYVRGVKAVAVPSCRILHLHAPEGRGAGYGSENTRLYIDTVRYSRALEAEGIDRVSLPNNLRGCMWDDHYIEAGKRAGA